MTNLLSELPLNFFNPKSLQVKFSELDLSSDAGLLLIRQAEEKLQICSGLANCLTDNRESSKVTHPLPQLISQRVYQIAAGYEDTNDSNALRHDPIFKIICNKVPIPGQELLASQPTMSRLDNQATARDIKAIRRFFSNNFCKVIPNHRQRSCWI